MALFGAQLHHTPFLILSLRHPYHASLIIGTALKICVTLYRKRGVERSDQTYPTMGETLSAPQPSSAEDNRTSPLQVAHRVLCSIKGRQSAGHRNSSRGGYVTYSKSAESF